MTDNHAEQNAASWLETIRELVEALESAELQGDPQDVDDAQDRIYEAPLSVMVRDAWRSSDAESEGPEEYEILLTTGGPALRLTGSIDCGEPDTWPRLEYQHWGAPWTEYEPARIHRETLRSFAAHFIFPH